MVQYMIADKGDLRKYRTELPNIIDDMDLSVYAYRLYGHLKRVAGDSGKCWQSTATLAAACKMSEGMISKAKEELVQKGLIAIEKVKLERGGRDAHNITVLDIWLENFIKYAGHKPTSPDEQASSLYEVASSPHEQPSSPHEIKKEPIKNKPDNKNVKRGTRSRATTPEEEAAKAALKAAKEKRNAEVEQIAQLLAEITGMDYIKNIGQLKKEAAHFSLTDIPILQADYLPPPSGKSPERGWYKYDWRGQRGERPDLYVIRKKFGSFEPVRVNGNGKTHTPTVQDERLAGIQRARERYANGTTR